ncbi:MAG TPA: hypothetical protein VFJ02_03040 [Vicinamibacterales bacterium]|nr:hypothetical protein [Vicinamibacterales bacterium]
MTRDRAAVGVRTRTERFYVRMAATFLAVGVIGFMPTYWLPLLRGTLHVHPWTHFHALFFYGWLTLFVTQTSLAASGRLARHRELGVLGVALVSGMCFVGLGMTVHSLKSSIALGFDDAARAFSIVSATAIVLFAALFAAAIVNVKRPDVHKRLMLVATASILQAAVGRVFLLVIASRPFEGVVGANGPPPVAVTVGPALVVDLLIVIAMVHDRRTRGRIHPVYWIAGGIVLAVQVLRVPISTTAAWTHVTSWLLAIAP